MEFFLSLLLEVIDVFDLKVSIFIYKDTFG